MLAIYLFLIFLGIMLSLFTKFHFTLVFKNITTLESLEKKGTSFHSPFDTGLRSNWEQVFGPNPKMWFIPLSCFGGKPIGNGVSWPQIDENGNQIIMSYDDAQSEGNIEQEYHKMQTNMIKQDSLNKQWKGDYQNSADYYERISKDHAQAKEQFIKTVQLSKQEDDKVKMHSSKVEVNDDNENTKKLYLKSLLQH